LKYRPDFRWRNALLLGGLVALLVGIGLTVWVEGPWRGLPYHDAFSSGRIDEWTAYAGNWDLVNGAIKNDSDERGAKLITGSPHWKSYAIEADLKLLGTGDAGIVIRASNIERGVDSYDGYYGGLRTNDQTLVLGRSMHGWHEFPTKAMPGGVLPGRWYRLRLAAQGCVISVSATAIGTTNTATIRVLDPDCLRRGRAGLRSMGAGGMWRNIHIVRLPDRIPNGGAAAMVPTHTALYPTSQGSAPLASMAGIGNSTPARAPEPARTIQSIRNLRLFSVTKPAHAIVRGAVILTNPALYIQDSSGGVRVQLVTPVPLKIGDEVEVEGDIYPHGLSASIRNAIARPVGGLAPIPPLSVTADQAATGAYDSMFIEVEGRLSGNGSSQKHARTLDLEDGMQVFRAISNSSPTSSAFDRVENNSVVRLRGVCMVNPAYTGNTVPFVVIVSSPDGVKVLLGPPWWSAEHLILLAIAMLGLGFLAHLFYSRAEEWRLRAVITERERLAHEMHDTLAQSFAGIGFQLRAIRNRLSRNKTTMDVQSLLDELNLASELVRHSHDEARRSITTLRPDTFKTGGLIFALEQSARRMVARSSVVVEASLAGETRTLPMRVLDSFFRIGQEAIANAIQHGHPTRIVIRVIYAVTSVTLIIKDDGCGFILKPESSGFGITGMRRRAELIGATLEIESTLSHGTRIEVKAATPPLPWRIRLAYSKRRDQEYPADAS
jgi:signal transduction histidine kinase